MKASFRTQMSRAKNHFNERLEKIMPWYVPPVAMTALCVVLLWYVAATAKGEGPKFLYTLF
jgi:hypothetical protein